MVISMRAEIIYETSLQTNMYVSEHLFYCLYQVNFQEHCWFSVEHQIVMHSPLGVLGLAY